VFENGKTADEILSEKIGDGFEKLAFADLPISISQLLFAT